MRAGKKKDACHSKEMSEMARLQSCTCATGLYIQTVSYGDCPVVCPCLHPPGAPSLAQALSLSLALLI